jgi:phospholipase C
MLKRWGQIGWGAIVATAVVASLVVARFNYVRGATVVAPVRVAPVPVASAAPAPVSVSVLATACRFRAGARPSETLAAAPRAADIPIKHVIVLMQENHSFDHYLGRLPVSGQPEAEGFPADFTNPDGEGKPVVPFHLPTTCFPRDPPHQWPSARAQWNAGQMNGFVTTADDDDGDGRWAMGYFDGRDLPFYYWLANTFTIGDRYFSAALGGTWPNRQFLYAATAQSAQSKTGLLTGTRTLFDLLDEAHVSWRVYGDGPPRQDCIGWRRGGRGLEGEAAFRQALADGTLPAVSFLDPSSEDEHPPADVQRGEQWARWLYGRVTRSPLWPAIAMFLTYDEGGGFFDHVPPPSACAPDATRSELDRRGTRVPLIVVSPWARPHQVSHAVHDHTSIVRFIELLHDLPALSDRDANADALLDAFDFSRPQMLAPPPPPRAGRGGCKPLALARR